MSAVVGRMSIGLSAPLSEGLGSSLVHAQFLLPANVCHGRDQVMAQAVTRPLLGGNLTRWETPAPSFILGRHFGSESKEIHCCLKNNSQDLHTHSNEQQGRNAVVPYIVIL